jgi:hypothetical protein
MYSIGRGFDDLLKRYQKKWCAEATVHLSTAAGHRLYRDRGIQKKESCCQGYPQAI